MSYWKRRKERRMCSFAGAYVHLYCVVMKERENLGQQSHTLARKPQVEKRES